MPVFSYKAIDEKGVAVVGELTASSSEVVNVILRSKKLSIQEVKKKKDFSSFSFGFKKVKINEVLLFCHEFVALLKSGILLPEAIATTANNHGNAHFKKTLLTILSDINGGEQPSVSFSKHPDVFDSLFVSAILSGEKTGKVILALQRYVLYLKKNIAFSKKVKQSLAYPLFLLFTLFVVMGLLFTFVMPRFISMYEGLGAKLPYATRMILSLADNLHIVLFVVVVVFIFAYTSYKRFIRTSVGADYIDGIKMKMPFVGGIVLDYTIIQLTSTLSTLLQSGLNLVDALKMTSNSISNKYFATRIKLVTDQVIKGKSFSESLAKQQIVPANTQKMIAAGEGTGQLANLLNDIMLYYEENLDYKISRLTMLIEPIIMLIIGLLVGGIIVVMYLPIFSMADIIK